MFAKKFNEPKDLVFIGVILFLLLYSVFVLRSIAPLLFPTYFVYVVFSIIIFFLFSKVAFNIFSLFSKQFYIGSIVLLVLPVIFGQITRGTIRWINLGPSTIQPSEIVRPFLFIFFSNFLEGEDLKINKFVKSLLLFVLPFILILIQPSLGVAVLTTIGFLGIILASNFDKKYLITGFLSLVLIIPLVWSILAPYQKQRVMTFLNPQSDPFGGGYNSMQSMIAVGSGKFWGRGLGKGVQTQLAFLPERHTDFIFASISEELGFFGAIVLIIGLLLLLYKLASFINKTNDISARAFISGLFLVLLVQTVVHIGMNMGLLPITGVTLPLVSAGGSSLIATMMSLGIVLGAIN
ncbi:MAG: FtsW/RodA/SpoVE family cell cycle protein [Patescibacteria group bacterium]